MCADILRKMILSVRLPRDVEYTIIRMATEMRYADVLREYTRVYGLHQLVVADVLRRTDRWYMYTYRHARMSALGAWNVTTLTETTGPERESLYIDLDDE